MLILNHNGKYTQLGQNLSIFKPEKRCRSAAKRRSEAKRRRKSYYYKQQRIYQPTKSSYYKQQRSLANNQGVVGQQNVDQQVLLQATAHLKTNNRDQQTAQVRDQEVLVLQQQRIYAYDQGVVGQQNVDLEILLLQATAHLKTNNRDQQTAQVRDQEVLVLQATAHLPAYDQGVVGQQNVDLEILLVPATAHLQANNQGVVGQQNVIWKSYQYQQQRIYADDLWVVGQQNRGQEVRDQKVLVLQAEAHLQANFKYEVEAGNRFYSEKWLAPA